jgi:2-polyprenyl-3-methyl-5-hydroxy-6-metoxy-1,4-benzoquinol methylase
MKYKIRKKCLSCNKETLNEIINLGDHSFADRFIPKNKLKKKDPKYPLILDLCRKCNFIQSRIITNPKERYIDLDYSYTSANSNYSRTHWEKLANDLDKKNYLKGKKIIEIGSNDGFLSLLLKKKGANVLCVDASSFMTNISKKKKLNSLQSIFDYKESQKIKKIFGTADLIIANNVFNHSDTPRNFLKGIHSLLGNNGMFIFEQPNFTIGTISLKFDQIYHEHISYFTAKNIKSILNNTNFKIHEMTKNEYHGGSLRTTTVKKNSTISENDPLKMIKYEVNKNIYKLSYYKKMMVMINNKKNKLLKNLEKLKKDNYIICGVGAGAKANTFLTFYGLNNSIIKFLTDSSKFKKNKFTPITRILIKNDNEIRKFNKIACLILSWNISSILVKKIKKLNRRIKIIYT